MSRRKRPTEHANHERWLVSYADFITLLFAFFVVLFSTSQVDEKKVGKLALAIQVAFQELGNRPLGASEHALEHGPRRVLWLVADHALPDESRRA